MKEINYNKAFALPNEVWSPVKGYEGLYAVSSMGRVKSLERINSQNKLLEERILQPAKDKGGYLFVRLYKDGQAKAYKVHRLVAEAFLGNPGNKPCVNHLNEVKTSNHYSNLEFCTHKENNNYGTRNERMAEKLKNNKRSKTIYQYNLNGDFIGEWPSTHEIERQTGFTRSCISDCCKGRLKTAYGYIWQYK